MWNLQIEELIDSDEEIVERIHHFQQNIGQAPSFGNTRNLVTTSAPPEPDTPRAPRRRPRAAAHSPRKRALRIWSERAEPSATRRALSSRSGPGPRRTPATNPNPAAVRPPDLSLGVDLWALQYTTGESIPWEAPSTVGGEPQPDADTDALWRPQPSTSREIPREAPSSTADSAREPQPSTSKGKSKTNASKGKSKARLDSIRCTTWAAPPSPSSSDSSEANVIINRNKLWESCFNSSKNELYEAHPSPDRSDSFEAHPNINGITLREPQLNPTGVVSYSREEQRSTHRNTPQKLHPSTRRDTSREPQTGTNRGTRKSSNGKAERPTSSTTYSPTTNAGQNSKPINSRQENHTSHKSMTSSSNVKKVYKAKKIDKRPSRERQGSRLDSNAVVLDLDSLYISNESRPNTSSGSMDTT